MKRVAQQISILDYKPYMAWFFMVCTLVAAFAYCYFLQKMIFEAAEARRMTATISGIVSEVNKMEVEYLSLKGEVTESRAAAFGFGDPEDIRFISKKTIGRLSLQNEI